MSIIIKDEHIQDVKTKGMNIVDVLTKAYEGEIADRVSKDERLKSFDAFQLAMMDAGISKHSAVKDFMTVSENRWLFPVFIDRTLRENVAKNDLMKYIASGTPVSVPALSVQGAYIDLVDNEDNKDATKKKRVSEGSALPLATIEIGESAISLKKYGRAVEATYETIQYQTVDVFSRLLSYIANDVSNQEFARGVKVLIDGDGNNNAAKVNTTASATLAASDLLTLAMNIFDDCGAPLDIIIAPQKMFMALSQMMIVSNGGIGIIPGSTFKFPQGINNDIVVIYSKDIPEAAGSKEQLIGLSSGFGLTKYIAEGSSISEYDSNILTQKKLGTISEIAGFGKPFKGSSRVLKIA